MTKKFIHTDKKIHGPKVKSEFLIPDIFDQKETFIGLSSGEPYRFGLVVYTGKELEVSDILEKANSLKPIGFFKKNRIKKDIERHLNQIRELKVGDHVALSAETNIVKTNLKPLYFKRNWEEERFVNGEKWGTSTWYFEVDFEGYPVRQLEVYQNGQILWFSSESPENEFGGLGDQAFDLVEFQSFSISKKEFEDKWRERAK